MVLCAVFTFKGIQCTVLIIKGYKTKRESSSDTNAGDSGGTVVLVSNK